MNYRNRVKHAFKRFWGDEQGQSTTEYILILAVVVMIAMRFKTEISKRITGAVNKVGENIDSTLEDIGNDQ